MTTIKMKNCSQFQQMKTLLKQTFSFLKITSLKRNFNQSEINN